MQDWLLSRYRLCTSEYDTVHHDQRDEQPKGGIEGGHVGLHQELYDRHKACYHYDEARDTHSIGDEALDHGDDGIGADEYKHRS